MTSGRQLRYGVAMSLDGYIAGPNGESDWIVHDPDVDFGEIFSRFDTLVMGRRTFEAARALGGGAAWPGVRSFIVSRTLEPADHSDVTIAPDGAALVRDLKAQPGKDIWLFGGGELFRSLLFEGLVDGLDIAVIPVLLGGGVPLLPAPCSRVTLRLTGKRVYEKSGIVSLAYDVLRV